MSTKEIRWSKKAKNILNEVCKLPLPQKFKFNPIGIDDKVSSSYHLCIECFLQLSFDSEFVYTKSATADDFVYTSESNESCEKNSTQR